MLSNPKNGAWPSEGSDRIRGQVVNEGEGVRSRKEVFVRRIAFAFIVYSRIISNSAIMDKLKSDIVASEEKLALPVVQCFICACILQPALGPYADFMAK